MSRRLTWIHPARHCNSEQSVGRKPLCRRSVIEQTLTAGSGVILSMHEEAPGVADVVGLPISNAKR
jgi:hypothetical protein